VSAPPEGFDPGHPELADLFDELPLWSAPFGLRLLDLVPLRAGLTVLDVGAGTGFLSVELAQRCGPSTRVIAVDPWGQALVRLRRKLAYLGLANVELLEQDAATLALPAASVDLVVSNLGIHNFESPGAVLQACVRAMKPEASLWLGTNLMGHMAELYAVYADVLRESGQQDALGALEAHVRQRGTVDSVSALLRAAGLRVTRIETDAFKMRFADGSALLRHHFMRLAFVPAWKAIVAPERQADTIARLERKLDALAKTHGELSLTIPMAVLEARLGY
jgi:arsenite methyltransferase